MSEKPLFIPFAAQWFDAFADGARPRIECLWLSPNCDYQGGLFA